MLRVIRGEISVERGCEGAAADVEVQAGLSGLFTDTTRTVTNVTPTLDFRYRFSNVSQLRVNYRGTTSQPSMTDLLDITDDSDPLNVTKGNPGLKPSFTNSLRRNTTTTSRSTRWR